MKRKQAKKEELEDPLRKSEGELTNDQLAKLAKMIVPKNLGPVLDGGKGKALGLGSAAGHMNSTNTMGN